MRKLITTALCAAALLTPIAADADPADAAAAIVVGDAQQLCVKMWPDDYDGRYHCVRDQLKASVWIANFSKRYPKETEEGAILTRCMIGTKIAGGRWDDAAAVQCTIGQLAAKRALDTLPGGTQGN